MVPFRGTFLWDASRDTPLLYWSKVKFINLFIIIYREEIFKNIEHAELQLPNFLSEPVKGLLKELLQKDPSKRLGGGVEDAKEIKSHPYFSDVNWDDVYNKNVIPPKFNNYSKPLQVYSNPKYFQKDDELLQNYSSENYLNGWSFIINE